MQTNAIKRFATEARNKLKEGIAAKIRTLGFDTKGNVADEHRPQLMQGGTHWNGQLLPETFYHQWTSLYNRIQQKGISEVYEEAAYTWFNRLCAIRILQKNDLCAPVLDYTDAARTPFIVDEARQGRIPEMNEEMRSRLSDLLDDDTKVTEQFAVLINAWCHDNPIIYRCFGAMADYTELLLPNNILAAGGFVDMLNHTEFITDEDFQSPELIGWLYQFYISERKDEVFAKKGKFEADEIPAATQIFTPNWIVKYMVQNTVGRIYLDNNPYETQLQKKWKYLVDTPKISEIREIRNQEKGITDYADSTESVILKYDELTDLRVADLACGSGHILNECFDLLYDLYIAEGYGRGEAIENIFRHNLTGVDLDTRAKQLATFALLLKACQKDATFADAHILPHVMDMAHVSPKMDEKTLSEACLEFMGGYEDVAGEMLAEDFELLKEAEDLGSIMCFNSDKEYLSMLRHQYAKWTENGTDDCPENIKLLLPGVKVILALTEKYHALVMNPPYMGGGKMNSVLSEYVKENYEEGKADLFSVFMMMGMEHLVDGGKMAQINMQSWMFLSSFEKLRTQFLKNYNIDNMLHLGPRTFDELSGEVVQNTAFVLSKHELTEQGGVYYRLVDGKNCADKEQLFLSHINGNEDGNRIYYPNVEQKNFEKIPGCPIGYWATITFAEALQLDNLGQVAHPRRTIQCGDVVRYIRLWTEVKISDIEQSIDIDILKDSAKHWFKFSNGGASRRWYGNLDSVLFWRNNGLEIKSTGRAIIPNEDMYFMECVGYNRITSNGITARLYKQGYLLGDATSMIAPSNHIEYLLALLNSKVSTFAMAFFNPTLAAQTGSLSKVPVKFSHIDVIEETVKHCVYISKQDWDAHETSWDFEENPLLEIMNNDIMNNEQLSDNDSADDAQPIIHSSLHNYSLKSLMDQYKQKWEHLFMQLHANEEELNRQFIDIYGLQDELTPDVPLDEITILQQGEISFNL